MKVVEVEWVDSAFRTRWSDREDARKYQHVATCKSVGYLLSKDKREVRLVGSQETETRDVSAGMSIPRRAVTKIRVLR